MNKKDCTISDDMTIKELKEKLAEAEKLKEEADKRDGKFCIVVLQRGWVLVGYLSNDGVNYTLTSANVIRIWGTTKGLGELALNGPLTSTKLDPTGTVHFHENAIVMTMDTDKKKWKQPSNYYIGGYNDRY